jgi:hypothetical protein
MATEPGVHARRRLLIRSGGFCAFPQCAEFLLFSTGDGHEDTNVGIECHIVPQKDHPSIARSVSALSEAEREQFRELIDDRHGFDNLVMMCDRHSRVIDDPAQGFSVQQVVEMKRAHETAMLAQRKVLPDRDSALAYSEIIDEWATRARLGDWDASIGPIVADGHPEMQKEYFDELVGLRTWLFSRVWPGDRPELEAALENFRRVCQDLQNLLSQHPHRVLEKQGVVAIARFYNDPEFSYPGVDHARLDSRYRWHSELVMDLGYELTRAANLVCDTVRARLDPHFRVEDGVVTITSGPYMNFSFITEKPHYVGDVGHAPYEGLEKFMTSRAARDITVGRGGSPEGVRLPGEMPF